MLDRLFGRYASDEIRSSKGLKPSLDIHSHMSREAFERLDDDTKFEIADSYQRTLGTVENTYRTIIQEKDNQIDILRGRAEYAEKQLKEFKMSVRRMD